MVAVISESSLLESLALYLTYRLCCLTWFLRLSGWQYRVWLNFIFISFLYKYIAQCQNVQNALIVAYILLSCLIHISIIIVRHFLYLLYSCLCLNLSLFMSYLCDLFFIFIIIFIRINHIISWIHLFFRLFLRICPIIFGCEKWMKNLNNFQIAKVQSQDLA